MEPWHVAHLVALGLWGGLVAVEAVIELAPRTVDEQRFAAVLHFWTDVLVELPVLALVLVTGAVLGVRAWPPAPLLAAKLCAGVAAVAANAYCVVHVVLRRRRAADPALLARHARRVRLSAAIDLPFAALAAYLGFALYGG